ncbi:MAG: hypothetical protein L7F78_10290 [Syntrophales bacterium LBB04]|nr:hypothetical protein [Syntrophales bacterium LBB04]
MKQDKSRLRQQILNAEASRQDHVQSILQEQGPLRSGTLVNIKRKCGKANCRCVAGHGHPTTYLSCKENGRTRMVYVPAAVAPAIAREAQRYRRLRRHRASLAKLAHQSLELIDKLQEALQTTVPIVLAKRPAADTKCTHKRQRR